MVSGAIGEWRWCRRGNIQAGGGRVARRRFSKRRDELTCEFGESFIRCVALSQPALLLMQLRKGGGQA